MVSRSFNVGRKTQTSDRTEMLLWSRSATNCPESGAVLQYVWRASQSERETARVKSKERERRSSREKERESDGECGAGLCRAAALVAGAGEKVENV